MMPTAESTPALVAPAISKSYGATRALADVDLHIAAGEVVALVGENGAGKSTLGKIIAGVTDRDAGQVLWRGKPVHFGSALDALQHGIAIVLQEFNLIPEMSVAENIYLTRPDGYRGGLFRSEAAQVRRAGELLAGLELDFPLDPAALVGTLSVAQQQMVEIVRAISVDAELFILDEPTAALGRAETEQLLGTIRALREQGKSVILVTHRLDEVYAVADRIVVLRDGRKQAEFDPNGTGTAELVATMVGRELDEGLSTVRHIRSPGEAVLEVTELRVPGAPEAVSFRVHAGEIVGIAGLVGSGRTELLRALFGADRPRSGQVRMGDRPLRVCHPRDAVGRGMALVTEDRKAQGLILDLPIYDNIVLSRLALDRNLILDHRRLRQRAGELVGELLIKIGGLDLPVSSLSGGNQQKVVLAKWLNTTPALLLLDEPTRGVDVGARADFYRIIDALVAEGMAVLMVSSELPEVLALSDRVLVMSGGRIVRELARDEATEEAVLGATDVAGGQP